MNRGNEELGELFDEFWSVKPRRRGSNPRALAFKSFSRAVRGGVEPKQIIAAAKMWSRQETENGKYDTQFVPMAATWLNQERYLDYTASELDEAKLDAIAEQHGWKWNGEKYVRLET